MLWPPDAAPKELHGAEVEAEVGRAALGAEVPFAADARQQEPIAWMQSLRQGSRRALAAAAGRAALGRAHRVWGPLPTEPYTAAVRGEVMWDRTLRDQVLASLFHAALPAVLERGSQGGGAAAVAGAGRHG
jgi:hypothetical protein